MRVLPIFVATYTLGLWITSQAIAAQVGLTGRVVGVADGDTLTVLSSEQRQIVVRLAAIDAPEVGKGMSRPGQPFGMRSRQALANVCFAKQARIELVEGQSTYGRSVGYVTCNGIDANLEMLRQGMAWVYPQYNRGARRHDYERMQQRAQSMKVGLWADPQPEEPWLWRKKARVN